MSSEFEVFTKIWVTIKNCPLWVLLGIFLASCILSVLSLETLLLREINFWSIIILVTSGALSLTKIINISYKKYTCHKEKKLKKTFSLVPYPNYCYFHTSKQNDGSVVTSFFAHFFATNLTDKPITIYDCHLKIKKLFYRKEVLQFNIGPPDSIQIDYIPPGQTIPVYLMMLIRGSPISRIGRKIKAKLNVIDSNSHKRIISFFFSNTGRPSEKKKIPIEIPSLISDPIEKVIASILQSEICCYRKKGRRIGGLGSIDIIVDGKEYTGLWHDLSKGHYTLICAKNIFIKSENLMALEIFYNSLNSENDKNRFIEQLINRIDKNKEYVCVSYFITCVLWKLEKLDQVLDRVRNFLPEKDTKEWGLSNVFLLLDGLLYYYSRSFSDKILDHIEQIICESKEHSFSIAEKIRAIRRERIISNQLIS